MFDEVIQEDLLSLGRNMLAHLEAQDPVEAPLQVDGGRQVEGRDQALAQDADVGRAVPTWGRDGGEINRGVAISLCYSRFRLKSSFRFDFA